MKTKAYISQNTKIMAGKPVIAGTRIPLSRIIFLLRDGYTVDAISEEYPHVNKNQLLGAIMELENNLDKYYASQNNY